MSTRAVLQKTLGAVNGTNRLATGVRFVLAAVLMLGLPGAVAAQSTPQEGGSGVGLQKRPNAGVASYYYYAEPGDLTIQVSLWGTVRNPGRYEIREGTDLGELLSYAGGPQMSSRQQRQEREITITVSRRNDGRREIVYRARVDSMIVSSEDHPRLQSNDIVTVQTVEKRGFSWRDALSVAGSAASLAWVIVRVVQFAAR